MTCGIASLPYELLCEIFEHAFFLEQDRRVVNKCLLPAITATCTLWRTAALATPRLWTLIDFKHLQQRHDSIQSSILEGIEWHLRWSKLLPIDIRIVIASFGSNKLYSRHKSLAAALGDLKKVLRSHMGRCNALMIFERGSSPQQPSFLPIDGELPCLRSFRIDSNVRNLYGAFDIWEDPSQVISVNDPVPRIGIPGIRLDRCDIRLCDTVHTPGALLTSIIFASKMRGLKRLRLDIHQSGVNPWWDTLSTSKLEFPNLEVLAICHRGDHVDNLSCIEAPNLLHLQATAGVIRDARNGWFFPKLETLQVKEDLYDNLTFHNTIAKHLGTLRVVAFPIAHVLRDGMLVMDHSAADTVSKAISAPSLQIIRVYTVDQPVLNIESPLYSHVQVVRRLLSWLGQHQHVRVEWVGEFGAAFDSFADDLRLLGDRWRFVEDTDMFESFFDSVHI